MGSFNNRPCSELDGSGGVRGWEFRLSRGLG